MGDEQMRREWRRERPREWHSDWLVAEEAGDDPAAEAAFRQMFTACSSVEPGADFGERVTKAAWESGARRRRLDLMARIAAAVVVSIAGLAAMYVAGAPVVSLAMRVSLDASQAAMWVALLFVHALEGWWIAAKAASAFGEALATPTTLAALVALELLGVSGIYALNRLGGDALGRNGAAEGQL